MEIRKFATRKQMDKAHRNEISAFPIVWAFSDDQFKAGAMEKWGKDIEDKTDTRKIVGIGGGGYILESDLNAFKDMFKRQDAEKKAFAKDFKELVDIIEEEMWNHEYGWSEEPYDTLEALAEYRMLPRFQEAWKKAAKRVFKGVNEIKNTKIA